MNCLGFGLSWVMDFELEMGFFIGFGNEFGMLIECSFVEEYIFGFVFVNDWSVWDI